MRYWEKDRIFGLLVSKQQGERLPTIDVGLWWVAFHIYSIPSRRTGER